ncbi:MAG: hypothetical protein KGJ17_00250, partial [Gammaproteobacteria bacterium]|nr:hypothetical protein [Gammaproteobacteria bacterium]
AGANTIAETGLPVSPGVKNASCVRLRGLYGIRSCGNNRCIRFTARRYNSQSSRVHRNGL